MIVDSPVLSNLPVGQDRVIPEQGDAQVTIPAMIIPVVEALGPLNRFVANDVVVKDYSIAVSVNIARNNVAALVTLLGVLDKGLWEFFVCMTGRFDYTAVGSVAEIVLRISNEANTVSQDLAGMYAAVGAQTLQVYRRVLLADVSRIQFRAEATAVAENLNAHVSLLANRLL